MLSISGQDDLAIIILSQPNMYHAKQAALLRNDLLQQSLQGSSVCTLITYIYSMYRNQTWGQFNFGIDGQLQFWN